ncbi:MAG: ketol-acid reductoisomerase [Candidatus Tectomicrobia bacterium]|uniref:Ketol-acid reductoisomerase (NADP(+)) n=1 Tax=Tectimicrobiota bacterium TaxID=2528274 RepID=A0A932I1Y7_UNCTE|nr:ketol-acid reductoisomerase [Candidatus Tectomicrobia bacterium]
MNAEELLKGLKIYYDADADLNLLKGRTVAVIGYGSQGRAHAMNLQDSGVKVVVGLRKTSPRWKQVEEDGLEVMETAEAAKAGDLVVMLTQDHLQPAIWRNDILPHMKDGDAFVVAHGFNLNYGQIIPPKNIDVFMIAPKSPGHTMRFQFEDGRGVPGLVAVFQNFTGKAKDYALAYGKGVGCARAGIIETTIEEETETDLFGEQVVLCGGITELIRAAFETLVEAGYQPACAYFECLHEVKLITDLIYQGGITMMRYSVSDTAEYGDITRGKVIIDQGTRERMKKILKDIQTGKFASEWINENMVGRPTFNTIVRKEKEHPIEIVGARLRGMMPWIQEREVK